MNEDAILDHIAVEQYLSRLSPERRAVLLLTEGFAVPSDWTEGAVTYSAIGRYIGKRFRGEPLSEAAIRYIREKSLEMLHPDYPNNVRRPSKRAAARAAAAGRAQPAPAEERPAIPEAPAPPEPAAPTRRRRRRG